MVQVKLQTKAEIVRARSREPYSVDSSELHNGSTAVTQIDIEQHGDLFIASAPAVGALSVVDVTDLVALHLFFDSRHDSERALRSLSRLVGDTRARHLVDRFVRDGWSRTSLPRPEQELLNSVYFTVTRRCNLACSYCYQGLKNRYGTEMPLESASNWLDKIVAVNENATIIVTGGEPFTHPQIFEILTEIDRRGLVSMILTNGSYIDGEAASHLHDLDHLRHIQLSIDGVTEEVHSMTRGRGHLAKVMRAFDSIVEHDLPFVLAPTLHDRNLHELYDVASLAISNGGWCSPNNLREFPHPGLDFSEVGLGQDQCLEVLVDLNKRLVDEFGLDVLAPLARRFRGPSGCSVTEPNASFVCGMAHALVDLDWNGDVYPCHLSKDPSLILGNLYDDDFDDVFRRVEERGIRVNSYEIPKCSGCQFGSTCGGGCRAGAFFAYGSLAREDELCELNYSSKLRGLLVGASSMYPSAEVDLE